MTPEALIELARRSGLVLGSGSPRREQILRETGVSFRQAVSQILEEQHPGEAPFDFAVRMAIEKASAVARDCTPNEIILGGDTIVVLDEQILSKPTDADDAVRILQLLSGQEHTVCTALALVRCDRTLCFGHEETKVRFNQISLQQIQDYVASGEPLDKAGAYGIQGMGAFLVDTTGGNLDTVVGLPLALLNTLAREALRII